MTLPTETAPKKRKKPLAWHMRKRGRRVRNAIRLRTRIRGLFGR